MTWRVAAQRVSVWAALAGGAGLVLAVYGYALWWAPTLLNQRELSKLHGAERLSAEYNARLMVISLGGALVVAVGLLYTARNYRLAHRGQVTDRFTKALERLGSDEMYVRIGGIHALEHVMRDSPSHHADSVEVLVAFIRHRTPRRVESPVQENWFHPPIGTDSPDPPAEPDPDVQAALTALGNRPRRPRHERNRLALHQLHLQGAHLSGAQLQRANLDGAQLQFTDLSVAQLQGARLDGAQLQYADLTGAQLQGAHLSGAQLQYADLTGAQLQRAFLIGAQLQDADLSEAQLQDAILVGAKLQRARLDGAQLQGARVLRAQGLSTEQPRHATVDGRTALPDVRRPTENDEVATHGMPHEQAETLAGVTDAGASAPKCFSLHPRS